MKPKTKYLLNVNGKRYRANTFIGLTWKFILNKSSR